MTCVQCHPETVTERSKFDLCKQCRRGGAMAVRRALDSFRRQQRELKRLAHAALGR